MELASRDFERAGGLALVVLVADEMVHESYFQGRTNQTQHNIRSGTKAIVACLACIAVSDGLLDFDERASNTLSEWQGDPWKAKITIRQLLSMTSGLDNSRPGAVFTNAEALQASCTSEPGTRYAYGSISYQAFSEILKRKLAAIGKTSWDYIVLKLLRPLNLQAFWRLGADGNLLFSTGLEINARDWGRFGLLIKNHGQWNKQPVVPSQLLLECFKCSPQFRWFGMGFNLNVPVEESSLDSLFTELPGNSLEEAIYIRRQKSELSQLQPFPKDLIYASGRHGQRLWICPSANTVIAQLAESNEVAEGIVLAPLLLQKSVYMSKGNLKEIKARGKRFLKGMKHTAAHRSLTSLHATYMKHYRELQ